ncbi:hypothetical protein EST38_g2810 [Candolleomyces aberdarensis]|uniref:HIT-type domain-containing protein n=1 Tax=Candolleomyces aberdarensis TaxID=2316362 RepID=A0A4Q2DS42_9AGAR|nr:hypothetical protein EST38_g2810 [Candolleomyces aberdarensis]
MESPETPIAIQTPSSLAVEDTADKVVCKLRQFAKYTCPNCNVPYCSLTCYRNEAHAKCSEGFYKKEIESGINVEPSKTAQERTQMLEVLKRFEEESAENEDTFGVDKDEDEDEDGLSQRLANIDLESASADTLWSILTPKEREKFLQAVNDPSSEVAQQLLSSDELRKNLREPWWKVSNLPDDPILPRHQVEEPSLIDIPDSMLKPVPNRPLLVYNIVSICICYAFAIRHLGVASFSRRLCDLNDLEEALGLVSRLVPFLMDRKSTLVHTSLTGVITDLWSRFDKNAITPDLMSTLLQDAAYLMSPSNIIEEDKLQSSLAPESGRVKLTFHPHRRLLLVLSDLFELNSLGIEKHWVPQQSKHVSHKLVFYGAHAATMPTPLLRSVVIELEQRSKAYHQEAKTRDADAESDKERGARKATGLLVEEL